MGEIAEILNQSTIHGLAHVANSKRLSLRLIWTFLLLVAIGACVYHVVVLVVRYDSHPVTTDISADAVKFQFPDLFICNPFPISHSMLKESKRKVPAEVKSKIQSSVANVEKDLKGLRDKYGKGFNYYYSIFPVGAQWSSLSEIPGLNDKYQTIIKASINGKELDLSTFQPVSSQEYHTCFKFLNSSLMNSPNDQMSLYLYADISQLASESDDRLLSSMTYMGQSIADKSAALTLFFTESGYYPGPSSEHIMVSCGMHTAVSVSMSARSLVNTKYDGCKQNPEILHLTDRLDNSVKVSYSLDRWLCEEHSWAQAFDQQCGCVPHSSPLPTTLKNSAVSCFNVSHWSVAETVNKVKCMYTTKTQERMDKIKRSCSNSNPCNSLLYNVDHSSAIWPAANYVNSFVNDILKKSNVKRTDSKNPVPAWKNVLDAKDKAILMMVRENVIKVDIRPKARHGPKVTESDAFPVMSLLSDIGGVLGLFLGMSFLSLWELFESVFIIPRVMKMAKKKEEEYVEEEEEEEEEERKSQGAHSLLDAKA